MYAMLLTNPKYFNDVMDISAANPH